MALATKQEIEALLLRKSAGRHSASGEPYSEEEKEMLRRYEGGGGIKGAKGRGVIDEFYTPPYIASLMWKLALAHGYKVGMPVLEPSCGPGRFFADAPKGTKLTGFEINEFSYQIARVLYPHVTLYPQYFETAFLEPDRYRGSLPVPLKR